MSSDATANVVRTATNALPGAPSGAQAAVQSTAGQLPGPQAALATSPPAQAQATNPGALPQQATSMPLQSAPATRADAAPATPMHPAADRAVIPQQAPAPVQTHVPSTPQGAQLLTAVPLAQQLAGHPQAQAVGSPLAGNTALDGGSPARAELTGTGTYTADGPGLRRRERRRAGARQMGQWIAAMTHGRMHLARPHDDSPQEAARAFQWLFWVLAIVAYGCLGLVLITLLPSFGELPAAPVLRHWTGEFAVSGLLAAVGAWWLGRRLTRASASRPDPIRR